MASATPCGRRPAASPRVDGRADHGAGGRAQRLVPGLKGRNMVSSSVGVHAADRLAPTLLGLSKARWRTVLTVLLAAFFVLVPLYAWLTGDSYVLILMGRILVFALAAVGLNLALGYGGMVSFGHAMYLGIGAYVVAIASHHGLDNGLVHLLLVAALTVAVAIPVGLIALRTQGIAFIMITLAFAQMLFFVAVGLKQYGGDEGLSIVHLSRFGALTGNKTALYLSMLLALGLALWLLRRVVASRFGLVLRATMINERRVRAVGTPPLGYRLAGYVASALLCALAGYFLANLTSFASPAYMAWTVSGELIVMVLLGGMGTLVGPVVGALVFLLLEEGLKALTDHWLVIMGPVIVVIVLFLKNGLWGIVSDVPAARGGH
ncbi:MAG TPA: branched-chain amino acid ABC transporter permease [Ottowia sp.]|uniref:branched-chain amino acid ABC transporter permease n=1 Tax=Ottowia sp. TaxID=1898956 RepID=UPI002B978070|nr:branched-chain amino acid ABC transporter permease [Ottowia sp.]HNE59203.1 branched-chain amino acid ABC transporter permease [Ottowia sp.]HNI83960.1 branched-chain amino acid ABC transporter permease [Ottowia sp.]HNJ44598.1 branched-chain amino acid ABC transporter permease [Ottowia sp.]HNK52149.1 branched-chain amino acid ABC transporter permease [Ottowia sp.]HNN32744.1 branched-chain amino acid ABC transporter permease [Ottowia sp.]